MRLSGRHSEEIVLTRPNRSGSAELREAIRLRAEEIYARSGRIPGRDLQNWAQAEQEIRRQVSAGDPRRHAVVVKVHGVQFVGEYDLESSRGYSPGEFGEGMTMPVRFDGEKMFVTRPNGVELETTVIKKVG